MPKTKNIPDESSTAPYLIVVHGPPKVGKSLLIKSLVKHYTNPHFITSPDDTPDFITSPVTVFVSDEEQRRVQFVECPNNVDGMIDAAKYADAVIFVIDVSYGFEMETLEFVNLLKVHGMPKVIGVFTHLDCFEYIEKNEEIQAAHFKKDFKNEIDKEAEIFCISAPVEEMYLECDICKLASVISGMEFHPISWRAAQPYVVVDHLEAFTPAELSNDGNRYMNFIFEGYLRGCDIKTKGTKVHIAGVGDFSFGFPLRHIGGTDLEMQVDIIDTSIPVLKKSIIRIGSYLKLMVRNVPHEMFKYLASGQPILVVGIGPKEQTVGRISARFERHSLHMKSLKSGDPIIVSVGWRRYQTTPIYALEDFSEILEFTPEDNPCSAIFWGPFATPGTGVVALQSLADNKAAFRILATGKVLRFIGASKTRVGTREITKETHVEVPRFFNPLTMAVEPSYSLYSVWKDGTTESEKNEAHVVWASRERKIAPEDLRETLLKLHEAKLKLSSQKRKTTEKRRAVIIVRRLYSDNVAGLVEAYQKQAEDISKKRPRGIVSTFLKKRRGK